jgi:hypothetical protein
MTIRRPQPPAPFTAPTDGSLDERLAAIAAAINSKASANVTPAYHSLALIDDTGQTWRVKVHADGTLHTDLVVPP